MFRNMIFRCFGICTFIINYYYDYVIKQSTLIIRHAERCHNALANEMKS